MDNVINIDIMESLMLLNACVVGRHGSVKASFSRAVVEILADTSYFPCWGLGFVLEGSGSFGVPESSF